MPAWPRTSPRSLIEQGQQPALSYGMKIDHGFMTVYYWLDNSMELPMVPIVLNCTTPPLMTMQQFYDFGVTLGNAIRSYTGWSGSAWSPAAGCRTSSASRGSATSTRSSTTGSSIGWPPAISARSSSMPNDELALAGNGTGELRAWVALAAAMGSAPGKVLSYEPVYEWINGMGVVLYDGDNAKVQA